MRFFRNAGDYGDPLKNVRFSRDLYQRPYSIVESAPRTTAVHPGEVYENRVTRAAGNFIEARPYSSQQQENSYPESHTPMLNMSEQRIEKYDPDFDRALIEHALEGQFGEKVLDSGLENMDSNDNWVDSATDEGYTILDVPGLVSGILLESAADDMSETDPAVDFGTEDILDDSSGAESPSVEQMLDEILDDAVDDMPLGDIEDILGEHMADDMPEDDVQGAEPDMDTMEDPMEMSPYTL